MYLLTSFLIGTSLLIGIPMLPPSVLSNCHVTSQTLFFDHTHEEEQGISFASSFLHFSLPLQLFEC